MEVIKISDKKFLKYFKSWDNLISFFIPVITSVLVVFFGKLVKINASYFLAVVFISTVIIWILFLKINDKNEELEETKKQLKEVQLSLSSYKVINDFPYPKIFHVLLTGSQILCYLHKSKIFKINHLYTIIKTDGEAEHEVGILKIISFQTNSTPVANIEFTTKDENFINKFIESDPYLLQELFIIPSIDSKYKSQGGY